MRDYIEILLYLLAMAGGFAAGWCVVFAVGKLLRIPDSKLMGTLDGQPVYAPGGGCLTMLGVFGGVLGVLGVVKLLELLGFS